MSFKRSSSTSEHLFGSLAFFSSSSWVYHILYLLSYWSTLDITLLTSIQQASSFLFCSSLLLLIKTRLTCLFSALVRHSTALRAGGGCLVTSPAARSALRACSGLVHCFSVDVIWGVGPLGLHCYLTGFDLLDLLFESPELCAFRIQLPVSLCSDG